ncbi:50S ribosomal protein L10 [Patescibacteria group bacterium]|nr:MAG: 50S ribosomal protein L10 [Patescibacteria group bacterium]
MLTKDQKKKIVVELTEQVKKAKALVFVDYKGVSVKDISELKRELRKEGVLMKVTRKTLFDIALRESGIELSTKQMEGQVAMTVSEQDEVAPAKILAKFSKGNDKLKILGGVLEAKVLSAEDVKALAKLPSKDEMLAKLVGTINAPVSGFVNVLAGNLRGLVQVLKAVSEAKS